MPAEQKDPGNPGEPSPTAGAQQLPIDEALARVAITTQQGSEGEGVGSSKLAKSHQKPHHQLSTSSLLTLSLAPASVLATAPLDQVSSDPIEAVGTLPRIPCSRGTRLLRPSWPNRQNSSKKTQLKGFR